MKKTTTTFFYLFSSFCFSQTEAYLPSTHRIYDFLAYENVYGTQKLYPEVKPFTFSQITSILKDRKFFLKSWNGSFSKEFLSKNKPINTVLEFWKSDWESPVQRFKLYTDSNRFLNGFIRFSSEHIKNDKASNNVRLSYGIYGQLHPDLFFSLKQDETSLFGNKELSLRESLFIEGNYFNRYILREKKSSTDATSGYISYQSKFLAAWLGRIPWTVGFGESGTLILDGAHTTPFTSIGLSFQLWKIRYHTIHGALLAPELLREQTDTLINTINANRSIPEKWFVNHRFELDISKSLMLHYNETIIYGNRSLDLNYLNPFSLLRAQEHQLYDRDNVLISFGFKWKIPAYHITTYHDILLDEWKLSKVFTNWHGNKHGMLNGITWANHKAQFWFEHVAIRPFTYTHKFEVNSFTHDGQNLGYLNGPNSQTFFYKFAYYLSQTWRFWGTYRLTHQGKNFPKRSNSIWNIGGDTFQGHRNTNIGSVSSIKDNAIFLEGVLKTQYEARFGVVFQPNYYLYVKFSYSYTKNRKNLMHLLFSIQY